MKPTTKAPTPGPTVSDDEPGNTDIDGISALDGVGEYCGAVLTGRGVARCSSALDGIRSITDILIQLECDKDSTGGIQASTRTTTGLLHALAVCSEFVRDHLNGGGFTPHVARSVPCDSPTRI